MCSKTAVLVRIRAACRHPDPGAGRRFRDAELRWLETSPTDADARARARERLDERALDVVCSTRPDLQQLLDAFDVLAGYDRQPRDPVVEGAVTVAALDVLRDIVAESAVDDLETSGNLFRSRVQTSATTERVPAQCRQRLRDSVEAESVRSCARRGRQFVDLSPACTWFATLHCAIAEDDARALAQAGDHRAASAAFEQLAFRPSAGCEGNAGHGYAAASEAAAYGDFVRQRALFERTEQEHGPPTVIQRGTTPSGAGHGGRPVR